MRAIAPDLTVRQVAALWPQCAPILERCPGSRPNGRWTLQELAPFARSCALDERRFLEELAVAAGVPVGERARPGREASPIPILLIALTTSLTLGAGWGVWLLLRIARGADYAVAPGVSVHVHGLAQLWGWMALFIFGVGAHLLRQNTRRPAPAWLERIAAGTVVAALLGFFAGLSGSVRFQVPWIDIVASVLLAAAAVLFGLSVGLSLIGRGQRPQLWHGFVLAGVAWLFAWAGVDLFLRLRYTGEPILPDAARGLLIDLAVLGFATNAIYGFGIRLIPGLLNLGRLRPRYFATALALHNAGLVLVLARVGSAIGAGLMLAACVAYLLGMNGLRGVPSRPIYGVDPRGHILIRAAFFWLACGLAMIFVQQLAPGLPHAYSGAWRHALTVGFITTMILGVGQRLIPVFVRQPLASTRLMLIGAGLILVGNAGRVILELLTMGDSRWAFRVMGLTGILELSALVLFAVNLAWTVANRRRVYHCGERLTPNTRVREAVNARPGLQECFEQMGITMFDQSPFIAPSTTFGALALAYGRQPGPFIVELEEAMRKRAAELTEARTVGSQ